MREASDESLKFIGIKTTALGYIDLLHHKLLSHSRKSDMENSFYLWQEMILNIILSTCMLLNIIYMTPLQFSMMTCNRISIYRKQSRKTPWILPDTEVRRKKFTGKNNLKESLVKAWETIDTESERKNN